jgi:hypothetical protein
MTGFHRRGRDRPEGVSAASIRYINMIAIARRPARLPLPNTCLALRQLATAVGRSRYSISKWKQVHTISERYRIIRRGR